MNPKKISQFILCRGDNLRQFERLITIEKNSILPVNKLATETDTLQITKKSEQHTSNSSVNFIHSNPSNDIDDSTLLSVANHLCSINSPSEDTCFDYSNYTDLCMPLSSNECNNNNSLENKLKHLISKYHVSHNFINELLTLLRSEGLKLPKDVRTLLKTPRTHEIINIHPGSNIHIGIEFLITPILEAYFDKLHDISLIKLSLNIDGLPLKKSSKSSFWPILISFKATEFHSFLLYSGPIVLRGKLKKSLYKHFMLLHCSVRLLMSDETCITYNELANKMLRQFVTQYSDLYGEEYITYNVHGLIHLAQFVKIHGSLDKFSAFKFENCLQIIKSTLKNCRFPLQDVYNRLIEYKNIDVASFVNYPILKKKITYDPLLYCDPTDTLYEAIVLEKWIISTIVRKAIGNIILEVVKFNSMEMFNEPFNSSLISDFYVDLSIYSYVIIDHRYNFSGENIIYSVQSKNGRCLLIVCSNKLVQW
ncbi:Uncharacterized protein FWK35_00019784 [Aphis craccivora]|uniref:DUF4806 domain-containing protein n=1 Tax=Aphis craccivora TaxID=307492 RepID=A0A6G0Y5X4_APHCR|nr:Uncharacterized protein FWK35_00019784 [Aphis craccivora]